MPMPKNPRLEAVREEVKALKPLPRYYGVLIAQHMNHIDIDRLHQMVAGRVEYPEGLKALQAICTMYPRKQLQVA